MSVKAKPTSYTLDLAVELYRRGEFGEAGTVLTDALKESTRADSLVSLTNNLAILQVDTGNYVEALKLYIEVAHLIDDCENDFNRANFHFGLARTYRQVATGENLPTFYDRALIEYEAARYYFELSGRTERIWCVENNIAYLLTKLGRADESHTHIEKARQILIQHNSKPERLAEVDDTLALVLMEQGRFEDAYFASADAVRRMRGSNELRLKAAILETQLKTAEACLQEIRSQAGVVGREG